MEEFLYHGSRIGDIKVFEPRSHFIDKTKKIVFATNDRRYALAMIHGGGDDLAVSYTLNQETGRKEMYIDELRPGMLKLLENKGYVYKVSSKYFEPTPEKLEGEYVSNVSVPVISEEKIGNILEELRQTPGVHLVPYSDVPVSMEKRSKIIQNPKITHSSERFKE